MPVTTEVISGCPCCSSSSSSSRSHTSATTCCTIHETDFYATFSSSSCSAINGMVVHMSGPAGGPYFGNDPGGVFGIFTINCDGGLWTFGGGPPGCVIAIQTRDFSCEPFISAEFLNGVFAGSCPSCTNTDSFSVILSP